MTWLLAGLGPELLKWTAGTGLTALLLALAYFSPIGKQYFVIAAAVVVLGLCVYTKGVTDANHRCVAQQAVVQKHVTGAVTYAKSKKALHARDPYDSPNN